MNATDYQEIDLEVEKVRKVERVLVAAGPGIGVGVLFVVSMVNALAKWWVGFLV